MFVESPYRPPRARIDTRPRIIPWFRAYAALCGTVYAGAAVWFLDSNARSVSLVLAVVGLAALHAVAAFVPFRPWGWTLAFVTLGFGIAGVAFVFAIPLAIAWNKPLVRAAFGRPP